MLVKKYIGYIYYGCCGISELHMSKNNLLKNNPNILKGFSFRYGLLLYLREELAFLKNKSFEYYTKIDDLFSVFLLFSETCGKDLFNRGPEFINLKINSYLSTKEYLDKYKFLAVNVSSEIIEIIEHLKNFIVNDEGLENFNNMKLHIMLICKEVENLSTIKL